MTQKFNSKFRRYPIRKITSILLFTFLIACSGGEDFLEEDLFDDSINTQLDSEATEDSSDTSDTTEDLSTEETADSNSSEEEYDSNDTTAIAEGQISLYSVDGNIISKLVDYSVDEDLLDYQSDTEKHQELWNQILKIVPEDYLKKINQFAIFVGDYDSSMDLYETLAYVSPTSIDLTTWQFGIAIDLSYLESFSNAEEGLNGTVIHELGHIVVLDDTQIDPFMDPESCETYHIEEGCTKDSSYMYQFYQSYWANIPEGQDAEETYANFPNEFISDYAATNIAEDMAETLRYFILTDQPTDNSLIKYQKISDYYSYENLPELRAFIRGNIDAASFLTSKKVRSNKTIRCGTLHMMSKRKSFSNHNQLF